MGRSILDDKFIKHLETLTYHMGVPMQGFFGGNHKTKSYGSTVEFADFREYVLGDDLRHIDWNLYSRFEKHYIKLFVDERQMVTQVFIDASASMAKVNPDKAAFAIKVAASMGYLSVHAMDRLSIRLIYGDKTEEIDGTITGKDAFFRALTKLEETKFQGTADISKAITSSLNIGGNDGLTVIISDFLTDSDWKKAVDYLVYRKKQVMLIQVLSPEENNPSYNGRIRIVDAESNHPLDERNIKMRITKSDFNAYKQALSDYKDEMKKFCSSRGVHYVSVSSDEPIEKFIFKRLEHIGTVK